MKPLNATLRVSSAVAMLALAGSLAGCYYVPYGYYPGYGSYPGYPGAYAGAYPTVPSTATQRDVPLAPGDPSQQQGNAQFAQPAGPAPAAAYPVPVAPPPVYVAPAYYPAAYPYPYYGYPGWWGPSSVSLNFGYWGGGGRGYWGGGHGGYWGGGGHGYWGGGGHGHSH